MSARRRKATIRKPTGETHSAELDAILEKIKSEPSCCCPCVRCDIGNHCKEEEKGCRM